MQTEIYFFPYDICYGRVRGVLVEETAGAAEAGTSQISSNGGDVSVYRYISYRRATLQTHSSNRDAFQRTSQEEVYTGAYCADSARSVMSATLLPTTTTAAPASPLVPVSRPLVCSARRPCSCDLRRPCQYRPSKSST